MTTVAVVPVKPLRRGKSRLAGVLSVEERTLLNRYLFTRTLEILRAVPAIEQVLVVSRDSAALALAREHGVHTLQEQSDSRLNLALRRAVAVLRPLLVSTILVLPADLPLLSADDVRALLDALPQPRGLAIAPSATGTGTNGLAVTPPDAIEFAYGEDSFHKHLALAQKAGLPVVIVRRTGLARDLDYPQDLALVADVFPEFAARAPVSVSSSLGRSTIRVSAD